MARYADTSHETIRQRSGWLIPLGVLLVTFALAALFLLFYLAPSPRSLFHEQISYTARTNLVVLKVHGHNFYVPANYLRYWSDRQGGDRNEVKLIALLPNMQGYSSWEDSSFRSNAADAATVEMSIHEDRIKLLESDWLKRIYMPYIAGRAKQYAFGLKQYTFRANSGYRDEDLFVGSIGHGLVILQCVRYSDRAPSPTCHRELPISDGIALNYRFKRAQLGHWREIALGIEKLIRSFQTPRSR